MARIVLAALFSLLLVGMQREMLIHEVGHLRAQVERGHDVALQKTASADCVECALLASGSNAVPSANTAAHEGTTPATPFIAASDAGLASIAPAYYQSRAPPHLL
jgi:hypothetical protein